MQYPYPLLHQNIQSRAQFSWSHSDMISRPTQGELSVSPFITLCTQCNIARLTAVKCVSVCLSLWEELWKCSLTPEINKTFIHYFSSRRNIDFSLNRLIHNFVVFQSCHNVWPCPCITVIITWLKKTVMWSSIKFSVELFSCKGGSNSNFYYIKL